MKPNPMSHWILLLSSRESVYDVLCSMLKRKEKNTTFLCGDIFCLAFRDRFLNDNFCCKTFKWTFTGERKRPTDPSQCLCETAKTQKTTVLLLLYFGLRCVIV